ncbi:hypothetical protein [Streptomyces sp. TLI_171]|uniref:hypothetical protein n=1 Tax=Streptomyces sp. TLI_171 TaxID=1938859 RepID=UPI000C501F78|nr:hypothetical protein [Streptomyces sp. TLI_171]RKE19824.1 hypothetical protein BX266_3155 [Streptomyces sp. TLI_171]
MVTVATIGPGRRHLFAAVDDHPVREGAAVLTRLTEAPDFTGARVAPDSGLHLDPERRALGCWTPSNCPEAYDLSSRWPGWAIDFWRDGRTRRLAAAPGRVHSADDRSFAGPRRSAAPRNRVARFRQFRRAENHSFGKANIRGVARSWRRSAT